MTEPIKSNKRIAKNAMMLYIRMLLTMAVSLYTSRVVLDVLGVEDYGTYSIVGAIVAMLGFLNNTMSGATSRFMAFEMGRGDEKRLADTFSSALIVHYGIAIIVFVIAETVGLWFLVNKLVIPEGRMTAAHWVYQMSIASAMLSITQVPYNATIIAHEKMDIYAYVEILSVVLNLLIVYLLTIGNFDKLILYAALVLMVGIIIRMTYRVYCLRHYPESRFRWVRDKSIMKPLLGFSGWNLYGNLGVMFQRHGTNFVINFFYGVTMNAALGIGLTVANAANQFASNVMTAFRPQIIKLYSQDEVDEMRRLTILAIKVIMFIYSMVAVPVFLETDNLLNIWLVEPPAYAAVICRIFLINIFFEVIRYIIIIDIHASGNVKLISLFAGTLFILIPFITYVLYAMGARVEAAFVILIFANVILMAVNVWLIEYYIRIDVKHYYLAIVNVTAMSALALMAALYIKHQLALDGNWHIITNTAISIAIVSLLYFLFCFDRSQRLFAVNFIKTKLHLK